MQMKVLFGLILAAVVAGEAPYPSSGWKPNGGLLVVPSNQQQAQYRPPANPEARNIPDSTNEKVSELERLKQQEGSDSGVYHVLLADGRLQKVEYAAAPLKKEEKKEKENDTDRKQEQSQYNQQQQYSQSQQYNQQQQYSQQQEEPAKVWAINLGQQERYSQERREGYNNYQDQQQFAVNAPLQAALQQPQPAAADWPVRYFEIFTRGQAVPQFGSQPAPYREDQAEVVAASGRQFQQQAPEEAARAWPVNTYQQQGANSAPTQQRPVLMVMPQSTDYVASMQYTDVEPINPPVYAYNKGSPLVRIVRKTPFFY